MREVWKLVFLSEIGTEKDNTSNQGNHMKSFFLRKAEAVKNENEIPSLISIKFSQRLKPNWCNKSMKIISIIKKNYEKIVEKLEN